MTPGPLTELGTASDNAGESYIESSTGATDADAAEDIMGLVNDGCVRLGEDVTPEVLSAVEVAVDIDGAVGAGGCDDADVLAGCVDAGGCATVCCAGATAAAAAAAYLTGRGRVCGLLSKPAFRMLAIGFCSKFGGGGGFVAIIEC